MTARRAAAAALRLCAAHTRPCSSEDQAADRVGFNPAHADRVAYDRDRKDLTQDAEADLTCAPPNPEDCRPCQLSATGALVLERTADLAHSGFDLGPGALDSVRELLDVANRRQARRERRAQRVQLLLVGVAKRDGLLERCSDAGHGRCWTRTSAASSSMSCTCRMGSRAPSALPDISKSAVASELVAVHVPLA